MNDFDYLELTNGGFCLIDTTDRDLVAPYQWRWRKQRSGHIYVTTRTPGDRRYLAMHRLILDPDPDVMVDHINGNGLDNRRSNLRTCTNQQNQRNRRTVTGGLSRFKGVTLHRGTGKWQAQIKVLDVNHYLGLHDTEVEAALAYDAAARDLFGEFAALNFDDRSATA